MASPIRQRMQQVNQIYFELFQYVVATQTIIRSAFVTLPSVRSLIATDWRRYYTVRYLFNTMEAVNDNADDDTTTNKLLQWIKSIHQWLARRLSESFTPYIHSGSGTAVCDLVKHSSFFLRSRDDDDNPFPVPPRCVMYWRWRQRRRRQQQKIAVHQNDDVDKYRIQVSDSFTPNILLWFDDTAVLVKHPFCRQRSPRGGMCGRDSDDTASVGKLSSDGYSPRFPLQLYCYIRS